MKAKVVIGAGFGDEGKGLFTDYLAYLNEKTVVVRFNGGAQAGHTVTTPDGKRHVFGHFTANSFLENNKGYLSRHFLVNPFVYLSEREKLISLGTSPTTACHDDCFLTTPYDMLINQWLEQSRNSSRHGSCGLGINETVNRSENEKLPLYIKDCNSESVLREKVMQIREFFKKRISVLGLDKYLQENEVLLSDDLMENFIDAIAEMKSTLITGVNNFNHSYFAGYEIIFEGAQGLMLDQIMGDFPHVTRSNTGLKNVVEISLENGITDLDVLYATRCYKTRHGAGVLQHELQEKPYPMIEDKTNIPNEFQGSLRFAYLDIDELTSFIDKDIQSVKPQTDGMLTINKFMGISCLDQSNMIKYYEKGRLREIPNDLFGKEMEKYGFGIYESFGPTRETIQHLKVTPKIKIKM